MRTCACAENSHIRWRRNGHDRTGANDRVALPGSRDSAGTGIRASAAATPPLANILTYPSVACAAPRPSTRHLSPVAVPKRAIRMCRKKKKQDITCDTNPDTCVFLRICQQLFIRPQATTPSPSPLPPSRQDLKNFTYTVFPSVQLGGLVNNSKKNVEGPKNKKTKIIITNERRGNFR